VVEGTTVQFVAVSTLATSFQWILNGAVVSTDATYNRRMVFEDTGKPFFCRVADASGTLDSVLIPITVKMLRPLAGYTIDIDMKIDIENGHGAGNISAYDYGQQYDSYTAKIEYITEQNGIDSWLRESNTVQQINDFGGLFPMGAHVVDTAIYGRRYPVYKGKYDMAGKFHRWEVTVIPVMGGVYSYASFSTWECKTVTNFTFGSLVDFPVPTIEPVSEFNISYNRAGYLVREYDFGRDRTTKKARLKWSNLNHTQAAALVSCIVQQVRGIPFTIDYKNIYQMAPWFPNVSDTGTIFTMRLSSSEISIKNSSGNLWEIEIEVVRVGNN
jgi:hypothetical protein